MLVFLNLSLLFPLSDLPDTASQSNMPFCQFLSWVLLFPVRTRVLLMVLGGDSQR